MSPKHLLGRHKDVKEEEFAYHAKPPLTHEKCDEVVWHEPYMARRYRRARLVLFRSVFFLFVVQRYRVVTHAVFDTLQGLIGLIKVATIDLGSGLLQAGHRCVERGDHNKKHHIDIGQE